MSTTAETLTLTPLSDKDLTPNVLRHVNPAAPAGMRQAAARGKALLPPPEVLLALYQSAALAAQAGDSETVQVARDAAAGLPDPLLRGGLQSLTSAPVLDFLARSLPRSRENLELLLRHRSIADATVQHLVSHCGAEEVDLIATDEQRLLRHPGIIAAMYMNPRARSSTALRAIELAARNQIAVDIPGFEDIVAALTGIVINREDDQKYQAVAESSAKEAVEVDPDDEDAVTQEVIEQTQAKEEAKSADQKMEEAKKRFEDLPVPFQIRLATLGTAYDRSVAIRSTVRTVCLAAIRSPGVRPEEAVKYAGNRALHADVISYIANRREWTQRNSVRLALINNNKTPLSVALRFLPFLHARDLKALSKSRNIPTPLVKASKELMLKRERR